MAPDGITADGLCAMIRRTWPAPEYGHLFEVRNATGFSASRSADAIVMGLWPSRGLALHGMEIKISRSDWLRELRAPAKAEVIASYCDLWSLVVSSEDVTKEGEIPLTWGYYVAKGDKLKCVKEPTRMEARAMDRPFLAALVRSMNNANGLEAAALAALEKERKAMQDEIKARVTQQTKHLQRRLTDAESVIENFEKTSGLRISGWNAGDIGKQVEAFTRAGNAVEVIKAGLTTIGESLAAIQEKQ